MRIIGGALPTPTEEHDHRFGLRNYGLTYSGLFLMENAIQNDAAELGDSAPKRLPGPPFAGRPAQHWPSSARPQPPAPAASPAPGAGAPGHHQPQALPLLRPRYSKRRVTAVFGRRGKAELITTNATGHTATAGSARAAARAGCAAPSRTTGESASGPLPPGQARPPPWWGIRKGKIRFVAVAGKRVLLKRNSKALRTYVRRAGF